MKAFKRALSHYAEQLRNASLSEMTVIPHAFVPFGSRSYPVFSFLAALHLCSSHLSSVRQRVWL